MIHKRQERKKSVSSRGKVFCTSMGGGSAEHGIRGRRLGVWLWRVMALLATVPVLAVLWPTSVGNRFSFPALASADDYRFEGSGWGHGVGMCQYGARGMAARGYNYRQILTYYYQGTQVSKHPCPQWLRVGLLDGVDSVQLEPLSGSFILYLSQGGDVPGGILGSTGSGSGIWTIRPDPSGRYAIYKPDGTLLGCYGDAAVQLCVRGSADSAVLRLPQNNNRKVSHLSATYPLRLYLYPSNGKFRMRAVLFSDFETYLKGVAEVPGSWPHEAVKAQAVAARSYAAKNMGKHAKSGYDLCDEVCCQYYNGRDKEGDSGWTRAVDATRGEVVLYGGQVANTQYSSSCGGHTDNNEEVWAGSPVPYLRGVPCPFCLDPVNPYARWTVTYTRQQMEAFLNARDDSYVGTLYSMDLSVRTSSGRVKRATFVGSAGTKTISGERMRFYLGLRSSMVNVTPDRFDEYLLLANPGKETVRATVNLFCSTGETAEVPVEVPPLSRRTVHVDEHFNRREVSAVVMGDSPLVAERAMYFNYMGTYEGGSCGHGVTTPSDRWYLAEGCTAQKFDTWILFLNPGEEEAQARVRLLREDGHQREVVVKVPGRWRSTLSVDQLEDFSSCSFSAAVFSDKPLVVERAMYFEYAGKKGGHVAEAASETSTTWYFAEGYTAEDFDTWILVGNPEDRAARVKFRLCTPEGREKRVEVEVRPHSRFTLKVDDHLPSSEVSVFLESDVPVVAERAMYFNFRGKDDGSCALGVTNAGPRWYLAEGYTAEDFDTWILVGNPGDEAAEVRISLLTRGGLAKELRYRVAPRSRFTLHVDDVLPADEVSAVVEEVAGRPIVAERAMYFSYRSRKGGHASQGVPEPSTTWYFAEGYTGS